MEDGGWRIEDREWNTNEFHTILDLLSSILGSVPSASSAVVFGQSGTSSAAARAPRKADT